LLARNANQHDGGCEIGSQGTPCGFLWLNAWSKENGMRRSARFFVDVPKMETSRETLECIPQDES
jgi:hypothetical protein